MSFKSSASLSPALKETLLTPTMRRKKNIKPRTLNMPKHLTGDAFMKIMEKKRDDEIAAKEEKRKKRIEREEKRKEKEQLKLQKAQEREGKKRNRERKKVEEAERKEEARRERQERVIKKKEEMLKKAEERKAKKKLNCYKCGGKEKSNEGWVACDNCDQWWHITCTDTPAMSTADINWHCNNCRL